MTAAHEGDGGGRDESPRAIDRWGRDLAQNGSRVRCEGGKIEVRPGIWERRWSESVAPGRPVALATGSVQAAVSRVLSSARASPKPSVSYMCRLSCDRHRTYTLRRAVSE